MPSVFSLVLLQRFPNGPTWLSMLAETLFQSCLHRFGCYMAFRVSRALLGRCFSHMLFGARRTLL